MKKFTTFLAALMLCIGCVTTMTSCSDDNDDPIIPAAKNVAGTYNGDMSCSVMGQASVFEDVTFVVNAVDEATVNITISSFGEPPMQVPDITVSDVVVSGTEGVYTLAETEFNGTTDNGKAYSGTLQGTFANNTLTINFNLQYGAMPMPMICTFTAQKN